MAYTQCFLKQDLSFIISPSMAVSSNRKSAFCCLLGHDAVTQCTSAYLQTTIYHTFIYIIFYSTAHWRMPKFASNTLA